MMKHISFILYLALKNIILNKSIEKRSVAGIEDKMKIFVQGGKGYATMNYFGELLRK